MGFVFHKSGERHRECDEERSSEHEQINGVLRHGSRRNEEQ